MKVTTIACVPGSVRSCFKKEHALCLIIVTCCMLIYFYPMLNNRTTPGGDGTRIFPYLYFADQADAIFPTWNPYKVGGVPVLSDPERFNWVSWFVDADSHYSNIQFNCLLISVLTILTFSFYFLGIEVGISKIGATIVGLIFCYSHFLTDWVYSGRINVIVSFLTLNLCLISYIKSIKNKNYLYFLVSSFLLGKLMHDIGYYGSIMCFPILFFVGYQFNKLQFNIIKLLIQLFLLGVLGILLYAVFLFPLVGHIGSQLVFHPPDHNIFQSLPDSPIQTILPYLFVKVSILTFPLLCLYFLNLRNNLRNNSRPFLICLIMMMIIYSGKLLLLKDITNFLLTLPILQHMRGNSPILYMLTFCAAILSGFGYDSMEQKYSGKSRHIRMLSVGIIIALFLLQISFFGSTNKVPPTQNKNGLRERNRIKKILENDSSYFRIWGVDIRAQHLINLPLVRSLNGFSMFFKNEHRWQLSGIFNVDINHLRPHFFTWNMSEVPINSYNDLIYLSNLKYILTYSTKEKTALQDHESWKLVGKVRSKIRDPKYDKIRRYELYERINWKSSVNIYSKWLCVEDINLTLNKLRNEEVNIYEKIILDREPQFPNNSNELSKTKLASSVEVISLADNAMEFEVTSNKDAVLFVPEYYDKDWKALIDSNESEVYRANASFMAIPVAKGHHKIELYYSPYLFHIGLVVSIVTMFIGVWGGIVLNNKKTNLSGLVI